MYFNSSTYAITVKTTYLGHVLRIIYNRSYLKPSGEVRFQ